MVVHYESLTWGDLCNHNFKAKTHRIHIYFLRFRLSVRPSVRPSVPASPAVREMRAIRNSFIFPMILTMRKPM